MTLSALQGPFSAECPRILVQLGDNVITALLDTGASRSFVRDTVAYGPRQVARLAVRLGNSSSCAVKEAIEGEIRIGALEVRHLLYVMEELPEDCILGTDFMALYDVRLDLAKRRLTLGDCRENILFLGDATTVTLRVLESTTVPRRSQCFVRVESGARSGTCYLVEALTEAEESRRIIIARGFHDGPPQQVLMMNPQDKEVRLSRGASLAVCEVVQPLKGVGSSSEEEVDYHVGAQLSNTEKARMKVLLESYGKTLFATKQRPFGRTNAGTHGIDTIPGAGPLTQRLRPTSPDEKKIVREEIQKMLKYGVVRPSSSAWSSPLVLVKKKDGTVRFCIDFRRLNDITIKDVFPLPRTSDLLESFQGARIFSTLDAAAGYWQVPLKEDAIPKSAFISSEGLFEFLVMPFGLCNAPATYQRIMNILLAGLSGLTCLVYLDDIIIYSKDFSSHLRDLKEVLDRLVEAEILLKPSKCRFGVEQVEYLGHIVSARGIAPDPKKVAKLKEYPKPTCINELRAFLGFAGYYRRFIRHFAMIAEPLFQLLKHDQKFVWNSAQDEAFSTLIAAIEKDAVLAHPRFDQPFIVDADASETGLGGILSQVVEGMEKPVAFISRKLQPAEQKWHIREKEALAVIWV